MIPSGNKIFAKESPFNEYWVSEELLYLPGANIGIHYARNLCSLQYFKDIGGAKIGIWTVEQVNMYGEHKTIELNDMQVGYEVRNFVNKEEEQRILRGV
jgi:hypothetical protein